MPVPSETIAALPPLQRRMAEAWLTRFEENWNDQKLRECMAALPAQSSLRRPLLLAMIERDLARQWDSGSARHVEDYVKDFPELGLTADLPVELIAAEYKVRQERGGADLTEFAERFPAKIDDLYVMLKPGVFENPKPPPLPPANDAIAARRLKLLRTPVEIDPMELGPPPANPLPRSAVPNKTSTPLPASNQPMWNAPQPPLTPSSIPEMFLSPQPIRPQLPKSAPAAPLSRSAPETPRPSKMPASAVVPPKPSANAAPMPKQTVGRYTVQRRLGSTNRGSNYLAIDTQLSRTVVLKIPRFEGPSAAENRARFQSEAKAAAGWHHPMLCPVLDVGQVDGVDYMATLYLEGERLYDLIKSRPIRSPRVAVDLILKVATAVDVAHGLGVLHRDLKPSNIFLTAGDLPVVVGFGQATRSAHASNEALAYIAPEQIAGPPDAASPQSDVYSLGVILCQLLTGQLPPPRERPSAAIVFPPDLDVPLQDICRKALSEYPDERCRSMADFAAELSSYLQTLSAFDPASRKPLPGSSQRLPLPSSAQAVPEKPMNSVAFAQMQQLRTLSEKMAAEPAAPEKKQGSGRFGKWAIIVLVVIIATAATLYLLNDRNKESPPPQTDIQNGTSGAPVNAPKPQPVVEPLGDLLRDLRSGNVKDRDLAIQKLSARKDDETKDALSQVVAGDPWPDEGASAEIHDGALRALTAVDAGLVPGALLQAAKAAEFRKRIWAYDELAKRVEDDNRKTLQPTLLVGLRDANPQVRRAVADQIRMNNFNDKETIQALVDRVKDNVWGEPNNSKPENFIHNPRADGGKDAALAALEALASDRVLEALNAAVALNDEKKPGGNLDVKKWAEHQKKTRNLK